MRLRLTFVYGALFLLSGAAMLAITYVFVNHFTGDFQVERFTHDGGVPYVPSDVSALEAQFDHRHSQDMHQLLLWSGVSLALMAVVSIGLGWLVAGRVLRPLRRITAAARDISATNLHRRLALAGPDDELKELGDTFDGLLARLEGSFRSQRQFVANASHELRTPLTLDHLLLDGALSDPNATLASWRDTGERLLLSTQQQERLIEGLLTLARSEGGLEQWEPFDLAAVTSQAVEARRTEAEGRGVSLTALLNPAPIAGDHRLVERLVANLLDNALRYNCVSGRVEVVVGTRSGCSVLSVTNTGPPIPTSEVERLFQPFQRLGADRTHNGDGMGLGLSIVTAIAAAHHASLAARPCPGGGLEVEVTFRLTTGHPNHARPCSVGSGTPSPISARAGRTATTPNRVPPLTR